MDGTAQNQEISGEIQPPVLRDVVDGVATLTLNDPRRLNALAEGMLAAVTEEMTALAADTSIRAIIIRGAGKHFCAGHDLRQMSAHRADADGGHAYFEELFEACSTMMLSFVRAPQPVIAEVTGVATAAGCQMVAACDLAVAAASARFATSGVNLGLFCSTPMVPLSRAVPRKAAFEMLVTGEFIAADEALRLGLINRIAADDAVGAETMALAKKIVGQSPAAIRLGKKAFYEQLEMPLEDAYRHGAKTMAENMMARDAECGIGAFLDKKPHPEWTGE